MLQRGGRSFPETFMSSTSQVDHASSPAARPPTFLRLSAGFVYFHFGFLKFFPDLSPGELLAGQTLMRLSLHWVDAQTALWWLVLIECVIGLSFLFNVGMRWIFFLFLAHQISTFVPLFVLPEITFKIAPFAPTLEGQYILKNLISVAAGWTVMLPAVRAAWSQSSPKQVVGIEGEESAAATRGLVSVHVEASGGQP